MTLGLLTPRNFYPVNFGHHFSQRAPAEAEEAQPRRVRGDLARRLKEARELTKPALALKMLQTARAQGLPARYLLVDAWFTSPTFCRSVQDLGLEVIGRLKRDRTLYYRDGTGYTLDQLYQAHKHRLVKDAALGLALLAVPVTCGNGLTGTIVFTKGYKEPDLETRSGGKIKAQPPWAAFFTTDLTLIAAQVVQKYLGRWAIEVFFKEAKQRLGLGQEQGRSPPRSIPSPRPFSVTACWPTSWSTMSGPTPSATSSANWKKRPASSPSWSGCGNTSSLS